MKDSLLIELATVWELQAETGGDGLNKFEKPARETLRACADALRMLVSSQPTTDPAPEFDVRKILLDVVPGDGSGFEVYAKNVADVERVLADMGDKLECYQAARPATAAAVADTQLLARVERELLAVLESCAKERSHHDGDEFHELLKDVRASMQTAQKAGS